MKIECDKWLPVSVDRRVLRSPHISSNDDYTDFNDVPTLQELEADNQISDHVEVITIEKMAFREPSNNNNANTVRWIKRIRTEVWDSSSSLVYFHVWYEENRYGRYFGESSDN